MRRSLLPPELMLATDITTDLCVGTHRIDDVGVSGDIAAEAAERLGERAFQNVDAVHDALALGDAAAARSIHADGVRGLISGSTSPLLSDFALGGAGQSTAC
jgi:hypothetical protein